MSLPVGYCHCDTAHEIERLEDLQLLEDERICQEIGLTIIETTKLRSVVLSSHMTGTDH